MARRSWASLTVGSSTTRAELAEEPDRLVGGLGHRSRGIPPGRGRPARTPPPGSGRTGRSSRRSTSTSDWWRKATRIGYRRSSGIRCRAWPVARRAIWARRLSRLGLRPSRAHRSTPAPFRNSSFSMLRRMAFGVLETADRRSQVSAVPPRAASGTSRPSSKVLVSSDRRGARMRIGLVLGLAAGRRPPSVPGRSTPAARPCRCAASHRRVGRAGSAGRAPGPGRRARS